MKIKYLFVPVLALLCSLSLINPAAAQFFSCVSNATDSDGDGFGYENNRSCIVDSTTITTSTNQTDVCEDRGGFPWGWNQVTLSSCRLDSQPSDGETPSGAGVCLDLDGDGFGWNGMESCMPESYNENLDQNITGVCLDLDGDGFGWNGVESCIPESFVIPNGNSDQNITGTWDRSGEIDLRTDVLYTHIGEDGEYLVYDYQQDDFGTGENCYTLDTGRIFSSSNSNTYQTEFVTVESDAIGTSENSLTIVRQEMNLQVLFENGLEETWVPLEGISLQDLSICE